MRLVVNVAVQGWRRNDSAAKVAPDVQDKIRFDRFQKPSAPDRMTNIQSPISPFW